MSLLVQAVAAGIMALVSAYMLFSIVKNNREKPEEERSALNDHNGLQIFFFFLVIASLIILGRVGFEATNECDYLINQTIVSGANTTYSYFYECTPRGAANASWLYRLPVYIAYLAGSYLIIYFLILFYNVWQRMFGGRGRE